MDFLRLVLASVGQLLDLVLMVYMWILVARILLSWVNPDPYNPIVRFLHTVTDPLLDRVRRLVPLQIGMLDLSPILIFVLINLARQVLRYVFWNYLQIHI